MTDVRKQTFRTNQCLKQGYENTVLVDRSPPLGQMHDCNSHKLWFVVFRVPLGFTCCPLCSVCK